MDPRVLGRHSVCVACGCRRLGAACVCHHLGTTFVYCHRGVSFICVKAIQINKVYPISDKKSYQ